MEGVPYRTDLFVVVSDDLRESRGFVIRRAVEEFSEVLTHDRITPDTLLPAPR